MNTVNNAKAICPYFSSEEKFHINCEGLIDKTISRTWFRSEKRKQQWLRDYCCKYCYRKCPIARSLDRKYAD